MPVSGTDQFTMLFDAITYAKGGSALKQLQHRVGAENYRRGVSNYLKENAYGTTVLEDFIAHQGKSAGSDLGDWSDEWLMTPGFNTLTVESKCDGDLLTSLTIVQTAVADQPQLRTHSVDVALYNLDADGNLVVASSLPPRFPCWSRAREHPWMSPRDTPARPSSTPITMTGPLRGSHSVMRTKPCSARNSAT
jgi:aminopeptidase N